MKSILLAAALALATSAAQAQDRTWYMLNSRDATCSDITHPGDGKPSLTPMTFDDYLRNYGAVTVKTKYSGKGGELVWLQGVDEHGQPVNLVFYTRLDECQKAIQQGEHDGNITPPSALQ